MKLSQIETDNLNNDLIKQVFFSMRKDKYDRADYLLIYGCHMIELLDERLEHALKIIKTKEIGKIVLTGGVGAKGNFNECEYMYNYLLEHGIEKDKILLENRSRTTQENNINIMNMLGLKNINIPLNIVLVTQEVHMLRIALHWKKLLDNNNIHFYYDYVDDTSVSYDKVINNPALIELLKNQLDKTKAFIKDGIYEDIDVSKINEQL